VWHKRRRGEMERWTTASPAYVYERLVGFKLHLQFDICSVAVVLRSSVNVALRCILKFSICNAHVQVILLDELNPLLSGNDVLAMDSLARPVQARKTPHPFWPASKRLCTSKHWMFRWDKDLYANLNLRAEFALGAVGRNGRDRKDKLAFARAL